MRKKQIIILIYNINQNNIKMTDQELIERLDKIEKSVNKLDLENIKIKIKNLPSYSKILMLLITLIIPIIIFAANSHIDDRIDTKTVIPIENLSNKLDSTNVLINNKLDDSDKKINTILYILSDNPKYLKQLKTLKENDLL